MSKNQSSHEKTVGQEAQRGWRTEGQRTDRRENILSGGVCKKQGQGAETTVLSYPDDFPSKPKFSVDTRALDGSRAGVEALRDDAPSQSMGI